MPFKAVIIDDEQPICDEIDYLLKKYDDIVVIAKFTNSLEAVTFMSKSACDIVFLDINMPGYSGLELAQKLGILKIPPLIIFVTAYPDHALEAFDTPAVGYITKPITQQKLNKIILKISNLCSGRQESVPSSVNRLCVINNGKLIPLNKQDIVLAYVKDKDVFVRTRESEYSVPLTLQELEATLYQNQFMRVHRQFIVNLDCINEIIPWFHGSYLLRMADAQAEEVPVSRSRVKGLKTALGIR